MMTTAVGGGVQFGEHFQEGHQQGDPMEGQSGSFDHDNNKLETTSL